MTLPTSPFNSFLLVCSFLQRPNKCNGVGDLLCKVLHSEWFFVSLFTSLVIQPVSIRVRDTCEQALSGAPGLHGSISV